MLSSRFVAKADQIFVQPIKLARSRLVLASVFRETRHLPEIIHERFHFRMPGPLIRRTQNGRWVHGRDYNWRNRRLDWFPAFPSDSKTST
jgi:hypothetical protein